MTFWFLPKVRCCGVPAETFTTFQKPIEIANKKKRSAFKRLIIDAAVAFLLIYSNKTSDCEWVTGGGHLIDQWSVVPTEPCLL